MKLHLPMENIHLEGTVSRYFDICPSFYSMKSRKSFDLSRVVIFVLSFNREKTGLLIDILNVYVPSLEPEISPFY